MLAGPGIVNVDLAVGGVGRQEPAAGWHDGALEELGGSSPLDLLRREQVVVSKPDLPFDCALVQVMCGERSVGRTDSCGAESVTVGRETIGRATSVVKDWRPKGGGRGTGVTRLHRRNCISYQDSRITQTEEMRNRQENRARGTSSARLGSPHRTS